MSYDKYKFKWREVLSFLMTVIGLFLLIGKLFFGTLWAGGLCIIFFPFLWKKKKKQLLEKRKKQLVKEFKDLILSFDASLKAGYSIENAFLEACRDLTYLYDASADILLECQSMKRQMENHVSLEILLNDLGERSQMADIRDFAKVFATAKKSGGDLNAIITNTADVISQKIELLAEIDVMLTGKKMEQRIMLLIPLFIMGYISLTSPGYFTPLYQNPMGILIMTGCLFLYATAYLLSEKIMEIHI